MPSNGSSSSISPKRILVVDDEEQVAKAIRIVLVLSKHIVEIAESAEEGLRLFELGNFDMTITDYALGKITGLDLARSIKARCPAHPIILVTAYAEALGVEKERLADVDLVIGKPFSVEQIQAALVKFFPA